MSSPSVAPSGGQATGVVPPPLATPPILTPGHQTETKSSAEMRSTSEEAATRNISATSSAHTNVPRRKSSKKLPSPQVQMAQARNYDTLAKIFGENDLPPPRDTLLDSPLHAELLGSPKSANRVDRVTPLAAHHHQHQLGAQQQQHVGGAAPALFGTTTATTPGSGPSAVGSSLPPKLPQNSTAAGGSVSTASGGPPHSAGQHCSTSPGTPTTTRTAEPLNAASTTGSTMTTSTGLQVVPSQLQQVAQGGGTTSTTTTGETHRADGTTAALPGGAAAAAASAIPQHSSQIIMKQDEQPVPSSPLNSMQARSSGGGAGSPKPQNLSIQTEDQTSQSEDDSDEETETAVARSRLKTDWIQLESDVCRHFDSARLGAKLFLLLLLRKIRDFHRKKIRYRELEEAMSLLYRALDEESQLLAAMYHNCSAPAPAIEHQQSVATTSPSRSLGGFGQHMRSSVNSSATASTTASTALGAGGSSSSNNKHVAKPPPTEKQHEIAVILFALSNLQEHTLQWKQTVMEAYANSSALNRKISFKDLAHFLDESIAVLEALYWKKKALM
ncbi:unnamed protein product [Amoebophrya sp. A120]|nr:unnamed protein product [Amoebophrya sp. A120]|eukprot:GSA120T00024259001.1